MRYVLTGGFALAGVLLFLLATASGNTERFAQHYSLLLGLNAVIAVAMFGVISFLLFRLWRRRRAQVFGTALAMRLTLLFALMAIVPGTLVYTVSVQFLSRSIESWFNVKVEKSLESGITLARATLDSMLQDVTGRTRLMALELADVSDTAAGPLLTRMLEQTGLQEAALLTASGKLIASSGASAHRLAPDLPDPQVMRQVAQGRGHAAVESAVSRSGDGARAEEKTALRMRVVAPIAARALGREPRMLQVLQPVPEQLTISAENVQAGYRDYAELSLSRKGLRDIYTVTLTLTLLLALFAAVAVAFYLSAGLAAPLSLLAQGTAAVAQGDFTPIGEIAGSDELGVLTQSFSRMTRQLDEARASVGQKQAQLESSKAYVENILASLSSGVLVLDAHMKLATANQSAELILGFDAAGAQWQPFAALPGLAGFSAQLAETFEREGSKTWQRQIEFVRAPAAPAASATPVTPAAPTADSAASEPAQRALLVRGTRLTVGEGSGYLIVCDDISALVSAQRSAAWGEVARRLAHEIKNPLTPIQLSAERLQMKLSAKLAQPDADVLQRGTGMIVNQVAAMQRMVDDFRDYARTPPAVLRELDLNALAREVLGLYENAAAPPQAILAAGLPRVLGDAGQLRQVIHNLLQNAEDAVAASASPRVTIATATASGRVLLTVADNGPGFPQRMLTSAFEPYVTTKAKGTGLGLAIVKKIVDEHQGAIELVNAKAGGARIEIQLKCAVPPVAPIPHTTTQAQSGIT